jgi:cytoskeletal protein CcmA (bactofilin family)
MFSRNVSPPAAKPKPPRVGTSGLSFIGPDVVVHGDIATDSQLHVDGRIEGDVRCEQLIQGHDGTIAGNIEAAEARLAGTVEGTVSARTLIVEATARIMGDVAYQTISIEAGAQIDGRLARRAALGESGDERLIATPVSFSPARANDAEGADALFALSDSRAAAAE